jgi:hypothetical protein
VGVEKVVVGLIPEAEMKKLALLLAAVVLLAPAGSVHAQGYTPYRQGYGAYSRPLLSPYLNMLRGGDPAANYYLGVIPEIDRRTNYARVRNNILNIEQQIEDQQAVPGSPALTAPLKSTGHPAVFLNTSGYFPGTPIRPGGQQQLPMQRPPGTGRP